MVEREIIESNVEAVMARLRAQGGNRTGTIVRHGDTWAVVEDPLLGRPGAEHPLSDDQMRDYVRRVVEAWWERPGTRDLPRVSEVLELA